MPNAVDIRSGIGTMPNGTSYGVHVKMQSIDWMELKLIDGLKLCGTRN